jgi:hypothetical protein
MTSGIKITMKQKVELFLNLFQGLQNVYGTYSVTTGTHWQIKKPVTNNTILNHLIGKQPYGFYPLFGKRTSVGVVDFDSMDPQPPIQFIKRAKHYGVDSYLERSKSKGFHVWLFFSKEGISAKKVRLVIKYILDEIQSPRTEIFPKQEILNKNASFGNFINAPLFGKLVPEGKTVFIRPDLALKPFPDQWEFQESIKRTNEEMLDSIIDINELTDSQSYNEYQNLKSSRRDKIVFSLPVCIRRILNQGVTFDQRVACFRIAVHLKRVGMPYDLTIATLMNWRFKNRTQENKRIITSDEIKAQVQWAYKKSYTGYGCQESVINHFCDPGCKVILQKGGK